GASDACRRRCMIRRWSLRVVSVLPSATEIVCALGAGSELVGGSHECDQPAEVAERPLLICSRLPAGGAMGSLTGRCVNCCGWPWPSTAWTLTCSPSWTRDWSSPSPSRPSPPGPPVTATFLAEQLRWYPAAPA